MNDHLPNTNQESLEQVMSKHFNVLFAKAYSITKSLHLAEEMVQDVFVIFYKRRHEGIVINDSGSYLYTCLVRLGLKFWANKKPSTLEIPTDLSTSISDMDQELDYCAFIQLITAWVDQNFTPREIKIFREVIVNGLDNPTCALLLDSTPDSVKASKHKIVSGLRRTFGEHPILKPLVNQKGKRGTK